MGKNTNNNTKTNENHKIYNKDIANLKCFSLLEKYQPYKNLLNLIWFLLWNNPIIFINFIIINMRAYISILIPNKISEFIGAVGEHKSLDIVIHLFYSSLLVGLIMIIFRIINNITDNKTSVTIDAQLSQLIYTYTINQDYNYRNQLSPVVFNINANNLLRLSKVWTKINRLLFVFVELILCLFQLYFKGNSWTNIITITFIISYILFFWYIIPINQHYTNSNIKSWNNLCKFINNNFSYLNLIHLFNGQNKQNQDYNRDINRFVQEKSNMLFIKNIILGFVDISFTAYQYSVLLVVIYGIYANKFSISLLTLFSILTFRTYHNIKDIINEYKIIEDLSVASEAMNNLFNKPLKSKEYIYDDKPSLIIDNYNINISNLLCVGKNNKPDEPILSIENLQFLQGQQYIILGRSGSGKTSLVNILAKLWDYHGEITIGNEDFNQYNNKEIRKYIHLLSQENNLLPVSIKENIGYGKENYTMDDIIYGAQQACIHDVIMDLPKQYETVLDDNISLSVGQKQRIAIARMFLSSAQVLIFDESTSSLDLYTESIIYSNIKKNLSHKTIILIAHRLGVLEYFHNVILIDNGKIIINDQQSNIANNNIYLNFIKNFENN